MSKYQFVKEWPPLDELPEWAARGRRKLNEIIVAYNNWQLEGFQPSTKQKVLALIEYGLQTLNEDGGSSWIEQLTKMKAFVEGAQ